MTAKKPNEQTAADKTAPQAAQIEDADLKGPETPAHLQEAAMRASENAAAIEEAALSRRAPSDEDRAEMDGFNRRLEALERNIHQMGVIVSIMAEKTVQFYDVHLQGKLGPAFPRPPENDE